MPASDDRGHTLDMRTVISIPDDVFAEAEHLARRMKESRSEIYSRAVREYVARCSEDRVTDALDALYPEPAAPDAFARAAARRALRQTEW